MSLRAGVEALIVALALGSSGAAGAIGLGHGLPQPPRGLHERLERVDAVAIATVEQIDLGRIRVRDARAVVGALTARFEVKRAPSAPPPLEPGDRVLLLLRGARPPFVLVDEPREVTVLGEGAAEDAWSQGLLDLLAADGAADRIASTYLRWIQVPDDDLRRIAGQTLSTAPELMAALSPQQVAERVRVATDPGAPVGARRSSALVALASERGAAALIPKLPGDDGLAGPEVLVAGIRWGMAWDAPAAVELFQRALADPRPDVRRAALGFSAIFLGAPATRAAIARVAAHDPKPELRAIAAKVLRRSGARSPAGE